MNKDNSFYIWIRLVGAIILIIFLILFVVIVNQVQEKRLIAENYCDLYGLDLGYYYEYPPTINCVGEDTNLTVVWDE